VWLATDSYNGNQLQRAKVGPSLSYSSVEFSIKSIKTNWFSLVVGGIEVIMNKQGTQYELVSELLTNVKKSP